MPNVEATPHFVEVIGSMDQVFVGPFDSHGTATAWLAKAKPRAGFDMCVMSESEMRASVAEYGKIPVITPEEADTE